MSHTCPDHTDAPCSCRACRHHAGRLLGAPGAASVHAPALATEPPGARSGAAVSGRECSRCSSGGGQGRCCLSGRPGGRLSAGAGPEVPFLRGSVWTASVLARSLPWMRKADSRKGQGCFPGPGATSPTDARPRPHTAAAAPAAAPTPGAASPGRSRSSRVSTRPPTPPPRTAAGSVCPGSAGTATEVVRRAGRAQRRTRPAGQVTVPEQG